VITQAERSYLYEHGYVPEHVPDYVGSMSRSEPHLLGDFLVYDAHDRLIFVGYPLRGSVKEKELQKAFDRALAQFKPPLVSMIAPCMLPALPDTRQSVPDYYYRLGLNNLSVSQKLRNLLRRSGKELEVVKTKTVASEHVNLIERFTSTHGIDEATRSIFSGVPEYVAECNSAWVFEGRNTKGELVVFDVADFGSREYAFYLFNFRSRDSYVPGGSDLLLWHIMEQARTEQKEYVNLGLGVSPGVTFFKRKWGAVPFLPHITYLYSSRDRDVVQALLEKL
jgi:hypothetical protein